MELRELDDQCTYLEQLGSSGDEPIVLINVFHVAPADTGALVEAWTQDARYMARQPGYVSTQLHRGIEGSATFVNVAEWESVSHLREAFMAPEFQEALARYPASAVALPHVFRRVEVPGICGG